MVESLPGFIFSFIAKKYLQLYDTPKPPDIKK